MTFKDDKKLLNEYRFGFTNIVSRPTKNMQEIKRDEFLEGAIILKQKINKYKPKIACFVGKQIYEIYSGTKKCKLGLQSNDEYQGIVYVMPSTSGLNFRFKKAEKLEYFKELKKYI